MHPILISLGPLSLSTYGAAVAAGYLAAILWLKSRMAEMRLDEKSFWRLIYCLFFGALAGGKLLYWAVSYRELLDGRLSLLGDIRYGFVFFGGVLGALAMGYVAKLWVKLDYMSTADYAGVALPLGHAIGRLGCLAAGCCYGRPTEMPWGLALGGHPACVTPRELWGIPLHPTQLYEAAASALISLVLLKAMLPRARERELVPGTVFLSYVALYGAARFWIEFYRFDDRGASVPPFSVSQWLALAGIGFAAALMARRGVRTR
ncbi:MAG: prolipoprotein diacylglyceryl transferase [Elusimicrobia bacterium]|nr:prolipoprotein diacylglyceryl transferase [Elusimicrobiota bacterium]